MIKSPTVGSLWPRQGFSSINADMCVPLRKALVDIVPTASVPVTDADRFETKCREWLRGAQPDEYLAGAIKHVALFMDPTPVFARLTVSQIMFVPPHQFLGLTTDEVAWRWPYYQFAFMVYWALLFHESNDMLKLPDYLASKIFRVWTCIYPNMDKLGLEVRQRHMQQLVGALLERTLGAKFDAETQTQCWRNNIADRRELGRLARLQRIDLFASAVDSLLAKWQNMILAGTRA